MSRRSHAFADGSPTFSWDVERIELPSAGAPQGRYKCTCRSVPDVFAFGDSEQDAIRAAKSAMEVHVDKAEV